MTKKRIGIIGGFAEKQSVYMKELLESMNVNVLIIDTVSFPESVSFSIGDKLKYQNEEIEDIKSFYVGAIYSSGPPYYLPEVKEGKPIDLDGWYSNYTSERERMAFIGSWIGMLGLEGRVFVDNIFNWKLHHYKPYQLALLKKHGIPVPKTLVTNSKTELLKFRKEVKEVIYKAVAGGSFCRKMTDHDWTTERLDKLKYAPVIFQDYIDGDNIRVYVLDHKIISCNVIYTDELDYRMHSKPQHIERVSLPEDIKEMCIKAADICGHNFAAIDVKKTTNNKYVVLEATPSPMFIGIDHCTGDNISGQLAEYLIKNG